MDDTLTNAFPPRYANRPETHAAVPTTRKTLSAKSVLKILGSTTALLVALGAVAEQGADLGMAITDLIHKMYPIESAWIEAETVVIEPDENITPLMLQICDRTPGSGESIHLAYLLGKQADDLPPAFMLKKKGCHGKYGRVWMNPVDFERHIKHPMKADFKLSYSRAHLNSLDQLVTDALNYYRTETLTVKATGGN